MSLSHLAITEAPAVDTWNQERSSDQLKGLLARLSDKAFADSADDFEYSF